MEELLKENKMLKEKLKKYEKPQIKRGDIVFVKMKNKNPEENSVEDFSRPYLVISNDIGNFHSNVFIRNSINIKREKNVTTNSLSNELQR